MKMQINGIQTRVKVFERKPIEKVYEGEKNSQRIDKGILPHKLGKLTEDFQRIIKYINENKKLLISYI